MKPEAVRSAPVDPSQQGVITHTHKGPRTRTRLRAGTPPTGSGAPPCKRNQMGREPGLQEQLRLCAPRTERVLHSRPSLGQGRPSPPVGRRSPVDKPGRGKGSGSQGCQAGGNNQLVGPVLKACPKG